MAEVWVDGSAGRESAEGICALQSPFDGPLHRSPFGPVACCGEVPPPLPLPRRGAWRLWRGLCCGRGKGLGGGAGWWWGPSDLLFCLVWVEGLVWWRSGPHPPAPSPIKLPALRAADLIGEGEGRFLSEAAPEGMPVTGGLPSSNHSLPLPLSLRLRSERGRGDLRTWFCGLRMPPPLPLPRAELWCRGGSLLRERERLGW
jgi:hypothetical protein